MKKLIALTLALVLALSLAACTITKNDNSGGNSNPPSSNPGNTNSPSTPPSSTSQTPSNDPVIVTELTPSITPAEGWTVEDDTAKFPKYKNSDVIGASFTIMYTQSFGSDIKTADEYVKYVYDSMYDKDNPSFSEITKTTVGGMDALEFTYTTTGVMGIKFVVVHVCQDAKAYGIMYAALEPDFDTLKGDFQSMLDSYTLK